jgi:hypothetical protein
MPIGGLDLWTDAELLVLGARASCLYWSWCWVPNPGPGMLKPVNPTVVSSPSS